MAMKGILVLNAALVLVGHLMGGGRAEKTALAAAPFRIHTLFAAECGNYFDWQTVGLMHSYRKARQPGPITRVLSCTDEEKKSYKGMDLAPTLEVPSVGTHLKKPAGLMHWLKHSKDAENVDWVIILDVDVIIRHPIIPWELGAEKGRLIAAHYGYSVGCDIDCDMVGGLLAIHIDDLRALAPVWLSKNEEILKNKSHLETKYTGEMYGYSLGAPEVGLGLEIKDNLMIYLGYIPQQGIEPILIHYGLPVSVGNWSFSKLEHKEDDMVYDCRRLFLEPPYPKEVKEMEANSNKKRALVLIMECINTLNEALLLQHAANGCPEAKHLKYSSFLPTSADITQLTWQSRHLTEEANNAQKQYTNTKIHTLFSADCSPYFDWQTVGLVHSFYNSGQPGGITRLLTCTDEELKKYKGRDLVQTHYVPSMSRHPITGDWYPAINKPAAIVHWINHVKTDIEYIVILDADMIMKGPITPWEFNASHGRPVSTPCDNLIGCDNELAKTHTRNPNLCNKVGGVIIMHIRDVRRFALLWLHKTEQVRADMENWSTNITGDTHKAGWMSQMYGYAFAAAELRFRHVISDKILIHPGNVPQRGVKYRVFHYSSPFKVGNWTFNKSKWSRLDMVNKCWSKFPNPPNPSTLNRSNETSLQRDSIIRACVKSLNEALRGHHERNKCTKKNPSKKTSLPPPKNGTSSEMKASRKFEKTEKTPHRPSTPSEKTYLPSPEREKADEIKGSRNFEKTSEKTYWPPPQREKADEITASRKFGKFDDEVDVVRRDSMMKNESQELSTPLSRKANQMFSSMRIWIVGLWGVSIFVFVVVVAMIISRHRGYKRRGKALKNKRRASH